MVTPKDLRDRAASYRLGGPSSEHTAKMLEGAAVEIEMLWRRISQAYNALNAEEANEPYDDAAEILHPVIVQIDSINAAAARAAKMAG